MKNRLLTGRVHAVIPLNLQFFAEPGDSAGADGGNGGGSGGGTGEDDSGGSGNEPLSFDDFLKLEGNQAEFDRRMQKAMNTAVTNAREKWQIMTDDKVSEAEKLAKMTAQERAQYLQKKKEKELADREAQITKRELMATAKNMLTEKGIPLELAEFLNYTDADSCNKSIAAIEKAFQSAVEKAVEDRLKGGNPPKKAGGSSEKTLEEQVKEAMNLTY